MKSQSTEHYNYYGWARRIDLVFRTHYPNLTTRIFEISPNRYVITFPKDLLDADAIREKFNNEIRFMTANIDVSNEVPVTLMREIPPLADEDIAKGYAGLPMALPELGNLVAARFPELPILNVEDGGDPMMVTVNLGATLTPTDEQELLVFCNGLEAIVPWQLNVIPDKQIDQIFKDPTVKRPEAKMPF